VKEKDGLGWLERNLSGNITQTELYHQREEELNSLDMMQNTNFLYHPESLLEF